jgi:hypothetical protein
VSLSGTSRKGVRIASPCSTTCTEKRYTIWLTEWRERNRNNPCHCENLLGFSLNQGWITQPSEGELNEFISARAIEEQIGGVREIVELYASLADPIPAEDLWSS